MYISMTGMCRLLTCCPSSMKVKKSRRQSRNTNTNQKNRTFRWLKVPKVTLTGPMLVMMKVALPISTMVIVKVCDQLACLSSIFDVMQVTTGMNWRGRPPNVGAILIVYLYRN
jgi:hypothetical protein